MNKTMTAFSLLAALLLAGLGGCGYKTLPVAPSAMIPRPITDLSYELTSTGAVLRWTYPDRTTSDSKLAELLGEQGIVVARRTVAKYREAMKIPSVAMRKSL